MLAAGTAKRGCGLLLCGLLSACASPGEPTAINALALGRVQSTTRPVPTAARLAARVIPKQTVVATAARGAVSNVQPVGSGSDIQLKTDGSTTIVASPGPKAGDGPKAVAAPQLVPSPQGTQASYSPLSPVANPVAIVPPDMVERAAPAVVEAHDAVLAPGPSLCDLNDGSTAADIALTATPCPASLRPTLRPGEPLK